MIYLDNAATTKVCDEAKNKILEGLECFSNPSSRYDTALETKVRVEQSRKDIAKILNCEANEIFFTSGGTEGDNWALRGVAFANKDKGKHIITSCIEHPAVLETCAYLEAKGYEITYLPVDEHGVVLIEELEHSIRPDTVLVSIMLVNNEIGTIQPIKEIAKICHAHNVLIHTDATQAIGNMRVDIKNLGVDLLTTSAHKFYSIKGSGFLYIKEGTPIAPLIYGGHQEKGMRAGTENVPAIMGMVEGLKFATKDLEVYITSLWDKMSILSHSLQKIPALKCNTYNDFRVGNIWNIRISNLNGEGILCLLNDKGIAVSTSSACTLSNVSSHVLRAIGLSQDEADSSIRISLGRYNTKEEMNIFVKELENVYLEAKNY